MNKSKAKGTSAESAFVNEAQVKAQFPMVERRTLSGALDEGDIAGCKDLVFELKNAKTYKIPAWLKETEVEKVNAKADFGILVVKPNGVGLGSVPDWWAIMPVGEMLKLLKKAGYEG